MNPGLVPGFTMFGLLTSRLAVGSLLPPPPPHAASAASSMAPGTCLIEPLRLSLKVVLVFMCTSVFNLSVCWLLLVQAGQGDMGNLDGVWCFARNFSRHLLHLSRRQRGGL